MVTVITVLPYFLQSLSTYFGEKRFSYGSSPSPERFILYAAELVLAILMIVYQKLIVNFIELKRRS
jgi:hypothetical protein